MANLKSTFPETPNSLLTLLAMLLAFTPVFPVVAQSETRYISLEEALNRSLISNRQLSEQRLKLQIAKTSHLVNIRRFFPQLTLTWSDTATINYLETDSFSRQLSMKISQFITDGGRTQSERRLNLIKLRLQEEQLSEAANILKDETWSLYMQTSLSREKIRLQSENLELSTKQLKIIDLEMAQGSVTELERLEAELQIKELEISLGNSKLELKNQERDFLRIINIPRNTKFHIESPDFFGYAGLRLPEGDLLLRLALENNSASKQLTAQLQQSKEQIRLARRQYVPSIQLEGSFTVSGNNFPLSRPQSNLSVTFDFSASGSPVTYTNSIGGSGRENRNQSTSMSVAILQNISGPLNMKSIEMDLRSLQSQLSETREQLNFAIEDAGEQYNRQLEQLTLKRSRFELEKSRYAILLRQWEIGEIQQIELLSANVQIGQSEINLLDSVMQIMQVEREIEKLIGMDPGVLKELAVYARDPSLSGKGAIDEIL